jgi:hypothetical protein
LPPTQSAVIVLLDEKWGMPTLKDRFLAYPIAVMLVLDPSVFESMKNLPETVVPTADACTDDF